MLKSLLQAVSPGGASGRLSVLVFHRVLAQPDPLFPEAIDAARFDAICGWTKSWFSVLPLDEAARRLHGHSLPVRALSITFDDGYADNHDVALPILARHGLPATFFIATGFLDGGRMWNDTLVEAVRGTALTSLDLRDLLGSDEPVHTLDTNAARRSAIDAIIRKTMYLGPGRREAIVQDIAARCGAPLPTDLMMDSEQVRALHSAGMQIGAHTLSHPILAGLDAAAAAKEMAGSRDCLESMLGERVGLFAYPSGKPGRDYTAQNVEIARDLGFDAAVSTAWGAANPSTDPLQIPRFTPWDRSRLRFGARLAKNLWSSRA